MPFYLCKVMGMGTEDDPRRPVMANYPGLAWFTIYDINPLNNKGCLVFCPNPTTEMEADPSIKKISKAKLDDFYTHTEFEQLKQLLSSAGINDTEIRRSDFNCRQIINWIGKKLTNHNGFDLKNYKVDFPGNPKPQNPPDNQYYVE